MTYVNGFVAAVPADKKDDFLRHSRMCAEIFKEHGALQVVDCWEDDVPDGEVTSFAMAVKRQNNEKIVFSWITWPSKDVCQEGMGRMMDDPRMSPDNNPMPFDGKRLIYGGFEMINQM